MLYTYSVIPLTESNFAERCNDIEEQVKNNVCIMPLFLMALVPEGNPVWDKATKMAELYGRYRDELGKRGVECGILVQASLGHGYKITPNPFQKHIGLFKPDGESLNCCCPEDAEFIKHFCSALTVLAKEHPRAIMIDDDFRILLKEGCGCACPLHMREFNRRTGLHMTREELAEYILTHDENDALTDVFRDIQRDSLIKAITSFRKAVDGVDPTIRGINCTSGQICEAVAYTSRIWAGEGNPSMVRIPNGIYAPLSTRGFSDLIRGTAMGVSNLKNRGVDIILAEADTIPFNRYGKSARYLHAQYTAALLGGTKGAKHWISRTSAFEPDSGKAYRKILKENYGMYEKLAELGDEIRWVGINGAFIHQEKFSFHKEPHWRYHKSDWIPKHIERMGLPFFFSEENSGLAIIEEEMVPLMSDSQIEKMFEKSVFVDGRSALELTERGFGSLMGVNVKEWTKPVPKAETFDGTAECACTIQKNYKEIEITDENTVALSHNYRLNSGVAELLAPAVTLHRRENGNITAVFCGSPDVEFNYYEGFSILNETRKNQLVSVMTEAGVLPIYCKGDDELCLQAGYLSDGSLLAAIYNLGIDPTERLTLCLENEPHSVKKMTGDGTFADVSFSRIGSSVYELDCSAEAMMPVILKIK